MAFGPCCAITATEQTAGLIQRYTSAMDSRLLDVLRNAPSLDLYELSLTVHRLLGDPARILAIRRHLHLGAQVSFFHHQTSTPATGTIVQLRPKDVLVMQDGTRQQWWLPYAAIVVDPAQAPASVEPVAAKVDLPTFAVGDTVGFTDKHLREHVGTVTRINDKTISIDCDGEAWRVPPRLLRKIIDI